MRKKAAITGGVAAAVLGGGLVLALNGTGTASAERTAADRPAATASPTVRGIGRAEAEQIALAAVPGGRVGGAELETEHGVPVWSVRVVKGTVTHDLDIDARTGKVVRDDRETRGGRRHDDVRETGRHHREAEHRHGEAESRHREAEHRHGDDDATDAHGRHGGDDGHRGHGG